MSVKYVYSFGNGKAEGRGDQKELLGGKGANLAEMARLGLPVPAGFTITTEACTEYYRQGKKLLNMLNKEMRQALAKVEKIMGKKFGDVKNPLLVSCRSGARSSMPGMMETVLNIGLNEKTLAGLAAKTGNEWFAWDSYRRLIQMYSDVVMEKAEGIEPAEDQGVRKQLERAMDRMKKEKGYRLDTDLTVDDLKQLVVEYKEIVRRVLGKEFPDDPMEQLWGGVRAVFQSWNGKRAIAYRRIEGIPDDWGTAVNVQSMVFGNMGDTSATGVAFTRNPATGENKFYGEWLVNAQGEDVVAGIRTPNPLNEDTRPDDEEHKNLPSLEKAMPKTYKELVAIRNRLEKHFRDMQDIEFTIEEGKLWMLQTRTGKRTGPAAVRMAVEMAQSKLIKPEDAVMRVAPAQLNELLLPVLDHDAEKQAKRLCGGLPAGPGGATGQVVFTADRAVEWAKEGKSVILVREETNPEDVEGMRAANGILTARGGMTSHAALVARGWGKCCIVGAGAIEVDVHKRQFTVDGRSFNEGDWISLNGTRGAVYEGRLPLVAGAEENPYFTKFMAICDKIRKLDVRANADTPEDAEKAFKFGARGIGLFRTEHMFYGKGAEEPLFILRKMIHSSTREERKAALDELFPFVKRDVKATMEAMKGFPVTIRLLDPPLHEFVPQNEEERRRLADSLNIGMDELKKRADELHEVNPMMGHRGVRLGITYPEVSEMQIRAILEAAAELLAEGKKTLPEIMIPVTCDVKELKHQKALVDRIHAEVAGKFGRKNIPHMFGTMIEIPRAALKANEMAEVAEFFSFGTNDLTQMTFGFSRDDIGGFVPEYVASGILPADPFETLDQSGVGQLVECGIQRGRSTSPKLKVGICGEHGGDEQSVIFCHKVGMNYVSCSPFRVPIARMAAAKAVVLENKAKKAKPKAGKKAKTAAAKGKKKK